MNSDGFSRLFRLGAMSLAFLSLSAFAAAPKVDKWANGQRFHGLQKISLNNSVQDASLVSHKFSRELYTHVGVPVPRAGHTRVELNKRDLGLYVLTEGWNKQFLKRHFKNTKG